MKKFFNKLKWWFKQDAKYAHRDFAKGVKNLVRWFPTIWKDRDWDDHFIWILLEKKLTHQSNYTLTRGRHLDATRDAQRMMTCVRLIQKVREEYYHMEYMDYQKNEFHWDDVPERPDNKQLRIEEISDNLDDYFKKYPRTYRKVFSEFTLEEKRRSDKRKIAMYMGRENHNKAKKLLFKMMEQHIESWWD